MNSIIYEYNSIKYCSKLIVLHEMVERDLNFNQIWKSVGAERDLEMKILG